MLRWLLVTVLVLLLVQGLWPWLEKLGLGRLPGDFRFIWMGRLWRLPLGSIVVLGLLLTGLRRLF